MRVVSLLPSATEIVCALGAGDTLVGRSHECDHPPFVERLPAVTEPRIAVTGTSAEIHAQVQRAVAQALSVYAVDEEELAALAPDLVVTQDLCEVCAVSRNDVEAALAEATGSNTEVVSLDPKRLGDVWQDVRSVGRALGREHEATARSFEQRIADLARQTSDAWRPSIVALEWLEPPMLGGLWMAELVAAAGGTHLGPGAGRPAQTYSREALADLDPDVVLLKPCGFSLGRTLEEVRRLGPDGLDALLPWSRWTAVRTGRVFAADGHALFNRPGPRLVESAVTLASLLHPELDIPLPLAAARIRSDATSERIEAGRPR